MSFGKDKEPKYDVMYSCNQCGGNNEVATRSAMEGHICEASTVCRDCGFEDYWAYGHFESGAEIIGKCRKY